MTSKVKNPCIQCKGKGLFRRTKCPRCKGKGTDPWKPGEMFRITKEAIDLIGWEFKFPKEPEPSIKNIIGLPFCKKCNGSGGYKGSCNHCSGSGWEQL